MKLEEANEFVNFHHQVDGVDFDYDKYDYLTYICICIQNKCCENKDKKSGCIADKIINDKSIVQDFDYRNNVYSLRTINGYNILFSKASSFFKKSDVMNHYKYNNCFNNSFSFTIQAPFDCDFVIGTYNFANKKIPMLHAWCEVGDYVIDPTFNLYIKKQDFYNIFSATPIERSTKEDLKWDLINKFYGYDKISIQAFYLARKSILRNLNKK